MKLPQTGRCQCGNIRYEITEAPQLVYRCHCKDCQRLTRDKLVRQAANYAVDREGLVKLLNGTAIPAPGPLSDRAPGLWRAEEPLYLRSVPGFSAPAAFHYPKPEE